MENQTQQVRLALCLPGKTFVDTTVRSLVGFTVWCSQHRIPCCYSFSYSPYIFQARSACLGEGIPLFQGTFDYTHILWVDSDIEFMPTDYVKLLKHDKDVVCAPYLMGPAQTTICEHQAENGDATWMTKKEIQERKELFKVDACGFGFILIKKGVFESIGYPWFRPRMLPNGTSAGEDMVFCMDARAMGHEIWCDPTISLAHHKIQSLYIKPEQLSAQVIEMRELKREKNG